MQACAAGMIFLALNWCAQLDEGEVDVPEE